MFGYLGISYFYYMYTSCRGRHSTGCDCYCGGFELYACTDCVVCLTYFFIESARHLVFGFPFGCVTVVFIFMLFMVSRYALPVIVSISPTEATGGTLLVISGTEFGPGSTVTVGGTACLIRAISTIQISYAHHYHECHVWVLYLELFAIL